MKMEKRNQESTHSYSPPHPHPWPRVCSDPRAASPPLHLEIRGHRGGLHEQGHTSTFRDLEWLQRRSISPNAPARARTHTQKNAHIAPCEVSVIQAYKYSEPERYQGEGGGRG